MRKFRRPIVVSPLSAYLLFLAYFLLLLFLQRLAILVYIHDHLADASFWQIIKALYIGLRFDARIAAIVTLPMGLALGIPPLRRLAGRHKKAAAVFFALVLTVIWLVCFIDFAFFSYLGERLNSTLLELAVDLADGLTMIWQSYPVILLFGLLIALIVLSWLPLKQAMSRLTIGAYKTKAGASLRWFTGFLVFAVAAYGQISSNFFPLRWSQAYFSTNTNVTALALNPLQNLFDTYSATQDDGFDLEAVREYYPLMAAHLGVDAPDIEALCFERRHIPAVAEHGTKPNVVVIIMESFSWPKSSFAPGKSRHTPFIQALAEESVYFPSFFANARTTARGVFSTMTGVPDVTESSTGSRNQRVIDQRIVANEFKGYQKYYMLGGNANWANIRGIIGNNIDDVKILEENFWKAPNVDVWGIHDYDLLMEAHEFMSGLKGPFLTVIQTASFHKPFTLPAHVPFELQTLDKETKENYSFMSEEEYNGFRFFDYALQVFFEKAKASGYYSNTIFILLGDHGITEASPNTSGAYRAANLSPWHVPLIIHAPGRLTPEVRNDAASQADVFPTAAALAGLEYTNWTLGRNLFSKSVLEGGNNAAFISGRNDVPLRLIMDGYCFVDNRVGGQFLYKLSEDANNYRYTEPERFARLQALARGYQASAKYLLYNNRKNGTHQNIAPSRQKR